MEVEMLAIMLMAHYLADFGLQSDTMARNKYRKNSDIWAYWLSAHGAIHGACIYLMTSNLWAALLEWVLHILIDYLKTEGHTNLHLDQFLHITCKVGYWTFL